MKLEVKAWGLTIIPENDQDQAYIRDTLGLRDEGDVVRLRRRNQYLSDKAAYLETVWEVLGE